MRFKVDLRVRKESFCHKWKVFRSRKEKSIWHWNLHPCCQFTVYVNSFSFFFPNIFRGWLSSQSDLKVRKITAKEGRRKKNGEKSIATVLCCKLWIRHINIHERQQRQSIERHTKADDNRSQNGITLCWIYCQPLNHNLFVEKGKAKGINIIIGSSHTRNTRARVSQSSNR